MHDGFRKLAGYRCFCEMKNFALDLFGGLDKRVRYFLQKGKHFRTDFDFNHDIKNMEYIF
jgi:hypothetical protein